MFLNYRQGQDQENFCKLPRPELVLPFLSHLHAWSGNCSCQCQRETNMTYHTLYRGDSRDLSYIPTESVHLVLTSPPYWNLKEYERGEHQLGLIDDYQRFVDELAKVWCECYRILVPGGRIVCIVGDVCLSRRKYGKHAVMPLHSDIAVSCRKIGFDNLNPILWHKIANARFEANICSSYLGKPYEPNAIIKNDIEYILMERKPGGYRKPTEEQRNRSRISRIFKSGFHKFGNCLGHPQSMTIRRRFHWNWHRV